MLDLKKAIEEKYKYSVASQCLILTGQRLADDKTIASYNLEPNKLVVLYLKVREGLEENQCGEKGSKGRNG